MWSCEPYVELTSSHLKERQMPLTMPSALFVCFFETESQVAQTGLKLTVAKISVQASTSQVLWL